MGLALITSLVTLRFSLVASIVARLFRGEGFLPFAENGPASEDAGYDKCGARITDINSARWLLVAGQFRGKSYGSYA